MEASQTTSNTRKRTEKGSSKADLKEKLKAKIKKWNSDHSEYKVEDLRRSLEVLDTDFKLKKQLYKWNIANPTHRVEGLRRSLQDLQDELKFKKQLFKWNQANPPCVVEDLRRSLGDLKDDFKLKKQRKKYIENQSDSTSDASTEASAASSASTTSSNPGHRKKPCKTFGGAKRFDFDKHQPPVTPRFEDHQNCDENTQTHLPDDVLQSAEDMSLDDGNEEDFDLPSGQAIMGELRDTPALQECRVSDADSMQAIMEDLFNRHLSQRINGEG
jgi:hypothetical protein